MSKQYYLMSGINRKESTSAFAPESTPLSFELIPLLKQKEILPFELKLINISVGEKGIIQNDNLDNVDPIWFDFQPNSLAWPLLSERLKDSIVKHLSGEEYIDFIKAKVNSINSSRIYYIPRFNKKLDVLDLNETVFIRGTDRIIKPVFSISKIARFAIFPNPSKFWQITSNIYVNESIYSEIKKCGINDISFEKVRVV